MNTRLGRGCVAAAVAAALAFGLWPRVGQGQAGGADRVRQLEKQVELLQADVKKLNATVDQLLELVNKLNGAVGDPQVAAKLHEIRAARTPAAVGKTRKLADLTDAEKAELMQIEGQIKIASQPLDPQAQLVNKLWDLGVYDAAAREMEKLCRGEEKVRQDHRRLGLAERLSREMGSMEKPESAEAMLVVVLDHPVLSENERGLAWLNVSAGACRKLYTADPVKYKAYLAKSVKLYETSLKLNPAQSDVKDAIKSLNKDVEK